MKILIIFIINISFTVILFFLIEAGYRSYILKTCDISCAFDYVNTNTGYLDENIDVALTKFDKRLGSLPRPFFDSKEIEKWTMGRLTVNKNGFRGNGNHIKFKNSLKILAVGDSFTFGYQVGDQETWPACVEYNLRAEVDNGGMFGYGVAQSILRADQELITKQYDVVILAILVGNGFARDQLFFRSGFSKPAVIFDNGKIGYSIPISIEDYKAKQSGFMNLAGELRNKSFVANEMMDYLEITPAAPRMSLKHPSAASIPEIVKFSLEKFSTISARKILIFDYQDPRPQGLTEKEKSELDLIHKFARKLDIEIIDPLSKFRSFPEKMVWNGHHTQFGNKLICDLVVEKLKQD